MLGPEEPGKGSWRPPGCSSCETSEPESPGIRHRVQLTELLLVLKICCLGACCLCFPPRAEALHTVSRNYSLYSTHLWAVSQAKAECVLCHPGTGCSPVLLPAGSLPGLSPSVKTALVGNKPRINSSSSGTGAGPCLRPRVCCPVCWLLLESFVEPQVEQEMAGTHPGLEDSGLWLGILSRAVICWGKGAISPLPCLEASEIAAGSQQCDHWELGALPAEETSRWMCHLGHTLHEGCIVRNCQDSL